MTIFLSLGYKKPHKVKYYFSWIFSLSLLDPCTSKCENEVRKIVHLKQSANHLLDTLIDTTKVTEPYIHTTDTPTRVILPTER